MNVLYEDNHIIIVNKASGEIVQGDKTGDTPLVETVRAYIKEKYNSILRCLFSYFSWRREARALVFLKRELNIPLGETDIRNVIMLEIEKLTEDLEDGWDEDGDDETHGGKRNGRSCSRSRTGKTVVFGPLSHSERKLPETASACPDR